MSETSTVTARYRRCPETGILCGCNPPHCTIAHWPRPQPSTTPTLPDAMNAERERLQADSRELARLKYGLTELERALLAHVREAHEFADRLDGTLALLRRVGGAGA
jgi:hypothetical protein